jgi:hypothetical protein
LIAIRWSHASTGASGRHEAQLLYARSKVSWAQSSAAARSPRRVISVPKIRRYVFR